MVIAKEKLSKARLIELNDRLQCELLRGQETIDRMQSELARRLENVEALRDENLALRTAAEAAIDQYERLKAETLVLKLRLSRTN